MRIVSLFLILILLITSTYALTLDNKARVDITSGDLFEMASIVEGRYGFEVYELSTYYERNVLVYEFKGYKTFQEGYTTREVPYSLKLNENLDPLLLPVRKDDQIGYGSIFLGVPGVLSYLFYKVIGIL